MAIENYTMIQVFESPQRFGCIHCNVDSLFFLAAPHYSHDNKLLTRDRV